MSKERKEYEELAFLLCEEYLRKQSAALLANLNKRNMDALDVSKSKILEDVRTELSKYQDENGKELTEEEKTMVIHMVKKELWGYGMIDDLIHDIEISDIKLYGENKIRIKRIGKRGDSEIIFASEREYQKFVTKILERNKVNLGTANAIQTFTDRSQPDFILRITIISGLLVDSGLPIVAIRKIPKNKYDLIMLQTAGMFGETKEKSKKENRVSHHSIFAEDDPLSALIEKMICSKGILFTGKGASGKTTLMNAMIGEIPFDESVMICQENAELFDMQHPDLFGAHVLTNTGDSKISYNLGDLTRAALLMDLDRVIVGEVKEGSEASGLSKASMTGHKCWTSVHGESCEMAVDKMADYICQATGYSTKDSLKQLLGFEYVVHLKDFHIDEVVRISGWDKENEALKYEQVYPFERECI